jgi:hypothetical protein
MGNKKNNPHNYQKEAERKAFWDGFREEITDVHGWTEAGKKEVRRRVITESLKEFLKKF